MVTGQLFLPQYSSASGPSTLPKSKKAKARTERMKKEKIGFETEEPEGTQIHGT